MLDTEILLNQGIVAKEKTNFETQMVLNHKQAIGFIIDNPVSSVDENAFKGALILFYEQAAADYIGEVFMQQFKFSARNYNL